MDDIRYNLLMAQVLEIASRTSSLFSSTPEPDEEKEMQVTKRTPESVLKNVFGYDRFRSLQREVIQNVLDGRDTLAVMPTGGGKSLCYEIPALLMDGLTVVISPLIALMQDQVSQLESFGIPAAYLNSSLDWEEYKTTCELIRGGKIKLLYISPEGLNTDRIQSLLHEETITIDCITIDEAHCISTWGHDFRPDYLEIARIREQFPRAVCLALTATATRQVQKDIVTILKMEQPKILVASFNRPNLYLQVRRKQNSLQQVTEFINQHKGQSGIIYCFSRKQVDELTDSLLRLNIRATNYHAGLNDDVRAQHQRLFIEDKIDVIVCTLAFGMGINKPDVRYVVHYSVPKSIEQYYQEIGRAGRDGLASDTLLLYSVADIQKIRWIISEQEDGTSKERLLQGMMGFAESRTCRRKQLLSYFGEAYTSSEKTECCCDICTSGPSKTVDVTVPCQKYLSCILRTHERYGASYVIDVLTGAKTSRIYDNNHDSLSTYGIGKELSKQQWFELNSALLAEGYLGKTEEHSVLYLTDKGHSALSNREEFLLPVDLDIKKKTTAKSTAGKEQAFDTNDSLAEAIMRNLKVWRKDTADKMNVPPFVIFGDKTMHDIARRKPETKSQLLECYGIGETKADKFGTVILQIVKACCS